VAIVVIIGGYEHVKFDPDGCSSWLTNSGVISGITVTVAVNDPRLTVLDVRFDPPPADHLPGYPSEHVRVSVLPNLRVVAVPVDGDDRAWLHRYSRWRIEQILRHDIALSFPWEQVLGALCLWYPLDPAPLLWRWKDGIDAYMLIVQRHLWSEEYWRRHGNWPAEDTPHGERFDGKPHPVLTPNLRSA